MKKIITLISLIMSTLSAMGNEYTDKLTVTVNGESTEQQATILITQGEDGKYTFSLNNFCLESANDDGTVTRLGVGNILLPDREGTTVDGITTITFNDGINITAGDDPDVVMWMGPALAELGPVPLEMVARFNETKLYCEIHINLTVMNQVIDVVFGSEPVPEGQAVKTIERSTTVSGEQPIYDITGRQVSQAKRHTLMIANGRKMIIR